MKNLILLLAMLIIFSGCDSQPKERKYTEIIIASPLQMMEANPRDPHAFMESAPPVSDMSNVSDDMNEMLQNSVAEADLQWQTPDGWVEQPGAGMRLVTFITQDENPIECSIVSLGGMAGGIEANITRWLGQINIPEPDPDVFADFMQGHAVFESRGGYKAHLFDLTHFQASALPTSLSMAASIIEGNDKTIFIKMSGSKKAVTENLSAFKSLTQSIQ